MATVQEIISILIKADGAAAVRELNKVGDSTRKNLDGQVPQKFTDKLKANAGTIAAWSGTVAGGVAVAFKLASAASELEQSVGAVDTVFGSASGTIADFADTSAESFGISERAANQLSAQFGAMLTNMGYTQQEAAATSVSLTKLGADLSAAFGGSPEEAVQALASALRGERDPIERFGVSIKEADVNMRLARMGMKDATGEAKKHATAVATLELIYEQTANVQGQFNREQDSMAGKLAVAQAKFEDLQAELGETVLPVMTDLVDTVNALGEAFDKIPEPVRKIATTSLPDQFRSLKNHFEDITDSTLFWEDALGKAKDAVEDLSKSDPPALALIKGMVEAAEATEEVARQTHDARDEQRKLYEEVTSRAEAVIKRKGAWREVVRAGIDLAESQDDLTRAQADYNAAVEEFGAGSPEAQAAARDVALAFIGISEAGGDAKQSVLDYVAIMGVDKLNAPTEAIRGTIEKLHEFRDTLAPGSPLRNWLDTYIADLESVPGNVRTVVEIDRIIANAGGNGGIGPAGVDSSGQPVVRGRTPQSEAERAPSGAGLTVNFNAPVNVQNPEQLAVDVGNELVRQSAGGP